MRRYALWGLLMAILAGGILVYLQGRNERAAGLAKITDLNRMRGLAARFFVITREKGLARNAQRAVVQGPRFLFEFADEAEAEKALDRVRQSSGRVRSLVPKRRSLEDLLVEGVEEEGRA